MNDQLQINQALHGYADGHQLLASSIALTREQQSTLLVMSDLSGPSYEPGFDGYLTAYPLAGGGLYCIAKTWYAIELPRPGCVWTHSILVQDQDLAQISDVRALLSLFSRPGPEMNFDSYTRVLHLRPYIGQLQTFPSHVGMAILRELYGSKAAVVLESGGTQPYEDVVIAIFSQQWPRLRRNFRFCTGALSLRDNNFDLAIAPTKAAASNSANVVIVAEESVLKLRPSVDQDDWVSIVGQDLVASDLPTELRQFLWRYGPDYSDGRQVFRALSEIHIASTRDSAAENVDQVLSAVGYFFPDPTSSSRLKFEFFGSNGHYSHAYGGEGQVLRALVTHPAADSIADEVAQIEPRARLLTSFDLETAINIALQALRLGGRRAAGFIDGFCEVVAVNEQALRVVPVSLVIELSARRPQLLTQSGVWRRQPAEQVSMCTVFANQEIFAEVSVGAVVRAILSGEAWHALSVICERFGREAILSVLEWIDSQDEEPLSVPHAVNGVLSARASSIMELVASGALGRRSLKVLSALLDARSYDVRRMGASHWIPIAEMDLRLANSAEEIHSRAFMLAIGLAFHNLRLIGVGFSHVYGVARANELPMADFDMMEPYLPWYSPKWDTCARLIRAAVRVFVSERGK